ncbi:DUF3343 domain-containing protein [Desulfobotulus sp. H1]|uniref:DUF3343 domain-containing protein n=1 Tax=Desulfobotulus pelophilus TaxID=2823377 RepID=A0ABT3NA90_9BACT|nr:DUF3343 domain-containing protein [Desulfobotulus pelophilus]MCW7753887.1 DUF3343 domain-containing protein [Desulfobotulus pelophilus]
MFFRKLFGRKKAKTSRADRGMLLFDHTSDVIQAENLLKAEGWTIKVMGPPPEIQRGCDLVVEFPLMEQMRILETLKNARVHPMDVVPVTGPLLSPVDLFHTKDFGEYLMVRAANMKITIEKKSRMIVNISGGGCPDVPFLADQLTGKILEEAPQPREIGHTLCGYALQLAYEEIERQCL